MPTGLELRAAGRPGRDRILTPEALAFVGDLQRRFGPVRLELLRRREERQAELDAGVCPTSWSRPRDVREADWTVARRRRTSTTGGSRSPARPSPR